MFFICCFYLFKTAVVFLTPPTFCESPSSHKAWYLIDHVQFTIEASCVYMLTIQFDRLVQYQDGDIVARRPWIVPRVLDDPLNIGALLMVDQIHIDGVFAEVDFP